MKTKLLSVSIVSGRQPIRQELFLCELSIPMTEKQRREVNLRYQDAGLSDNHPTMDEELIDKIGFGEVVFNEVDRTKGYAIRFSGEQSERDEFWYITVKFVFTAQQLPVHLKKYLYQHQTKWTLDDSFVSVQHPEICKVVRQAFLDLTQQ
jgi:hypothetical protein